MGHLFVRSEFGQFKWENCKRCGERIVRAEKRNGTTAYLEQSDKPPGDRGPWYVYHECEEQP